MEDIIHIIDQFQIEGRISQVVPWGNGLINDTYRIYTLRGNDYLLQRVNESAYGDIEGLMNNVYTVTEKIRSRRFYFRAGGIKPALQVIPLKDGKLFYRDADRNCWRVYNFMKDTYSIEKAEKPLDVLKAGVILGQFHYLLRDQDVNELTVIVPDYHNPAVYYQKLLKAANEDRLGRAHEVQAELAFFHSVQDQYDILNQAYAEGKLPLRVNHNDPKINNIMFDKSNHEPICMVDLDTIMPGLIAYDFGDAIRSCICTGKDSPYIHPETIRFDEKIYYNFLNGFLEGTQDMLTEEEKLYLPVGVRLIALESGIRYLTDYLNGDIYLKTRYPGQNLVKARMHIALAKDIMAKGF